MATLHDPETTTAGHDDATKDPAAAGGGADGETLRVQALAARGATPAEVATAMGPNPNPSLMAYLHQTRGNGFVQQVITLGSGGTTQPAQTGQPAPQVAQPLPQTPQSPVMLADAQLPQQPQQPQHYHPPTNSFFVHPDGQYVQVYVSPDGIDAKPDVFMFFHGQGANLKIDPAMKDNNDNVSGSDTAGAAMAKGKEKNTIALLPQGFRGGANSPGGRMDDIIKNGLDKFLDDVLAAVNAQVKVPGVLTPNHISLAGHSAGGHKGIHEALSSTGKYSDSITDITLMDTSYADEHFEDARDWMFTGSPNKTIRIVQGTGQLRNDVYVAQDDLKEDDPAHKPAKLDGPAHWSRVFSDHALDNAIKKHPGMTVNHIQSYDLKKAKSGAGQDRGNMTEMVQHTQILDAAGQVQCDLLVLHSELGHHEIRDSTMDDAIDSIGQGAAGSDQFGRNDDDPTYGRDPNLPHDGNGPTAAERKQAADARKQAADAAAARRRRH